jgi:hypothetical protein
MKFQCQNAGSCQKVVQTDQRAWHGPRRKALNLEPQRQSGLHTIVNLGWYGRPVAAVGLELTPDRRAKRSQFLLLGAHTKEPVGLAANKLFPEADPASRQAIRHAGWRCLHSVRGPPGRH